MKDIGDTWRKVYQSQMLLTIDNKYPGQSDINKYGFIYLFFHILKSLQIGGGWPWFQSLHKVSTKMSRILLVLVAWLPDSCCSSSHRVTFQQIKKKSTCRKTTIYIQLATKELFTTHSNGRRGLRIKLADFAV